jgi:prepilin-type N-terminal cleavage/methylation domain-containing protein
MEAVVPRLKKLESRNGSGFSLIEMIVASAIFAIAAAVAFILYTAAQKSYKLGENFTDQQQSTRVAFDRMLSDIRLAGFNYNPDGDTTRVDEQVEGAWDTAVTIRGDFDFEDPAASVAPEAALAGSNYDVVSTGNDEIVTYVLAKPGPSGPATLTLRLDPDKPRAKTLKTVTIPNAVLIQNNPPYTLYRVTMADVTGAFPASPQASTNFVFEPVAENIRTMTFQYYADGGTLLSPNTPATSADDIGGADAGGSTRARIRRISINLVGMTPDEDLDYTDVSDATATSHYRKFDLQSDVNMENMGRTGIRDLDVTPPPAPTNIQLVAGHCQGVLVKWDSPASSAGVSSYTVKYWLSATPTATQTINASYPHSEYGILDHLAHALVPGLTLGSNYCFQVQAKDSSGNQSAWAPASSPPCIVVTEASTPATPLNLQATGNGTLAPLDSQIKVTWDEVRSNAADVTGDPNLLDGHTILRDPYGYKLYRDVTSIFTPDDAVNLVAGPTVLGAGATSHLDTTAVACKDYYYKLVTTDKCGTLSAASAAANGHSFSTANPAVPPNVTTSRTTNSIVTVSWRNVGLDVTGRKIGIETYNIFRAMALYGYPAPTNPGDYSKRDSVTVPPLQDPVTYADKLDGTDINNLNNNMVFWYAVSAVNGCGLEGARSVPTDMYCTFNGILTPAPANGAKNAGPVVLSLVVKGNDNYVRLRVRVVDRSSPPLEVYNNEIFPTPSCTGTCTFALGSWDPGTATGVYDLYWEVESSVGCTKVLQTTYEVTANTACKISATNPSTNPITGSAKNTSLAWDLQNNAGLNLEILSMVIRWTNGTGSLGTHRLQSIEWPVGTVVQTFSNTLTPATASWFPGLPHSATANASCPTCPILRMQLTWDTSIANNSNSESVTVDYNWQDSNSQTGMCTLTIIGEPVL